MSAVNLATRFSTVIFSNHLKEMPTFLTIIEMLRMSAFKSYMLPFPHYLSICSKLAVMLKTIKNEKFFTMQNLKELYVLERFLEACYTSQMTSLDRKNMLLIWDIHFKPLAGFVLISLK